MPHKDPEARREYARKRRQDPEYRARQREWQRRYRERGGKKRAYERLKADPARFAADRQKKQEYRHKVRLAVIEMYGGECECCKESEPAFLAIDHVDGGGSKQRKEMSQLKFRNWLLKQGKRLPEYRILCHNCNHAEHFEGICPHRCTEQ